MRTTHEDRMLAYLWSREAVYKANKSGLLSPELTEYLLSHMTLVWSHRMSRTFGLARYAHAKKEMGVTLSSILWEAASEEERRETVYHEVAHIIVYLIHYHKNPRPRKSPEAHGREWKWTMRMIGYPNPSAKHTVANHVYEESVGNIPVYCGCSSDPAAWVSKIKAAKMNLHASRGRTYVCRKCRSSFVVGDK